MYKTIWTITALSSLAAAPVIHAGESSREERIGVGAGALIGAVAGGPLGLVAGMAIGGKLGDETHEKNAEIDSLTSSLDVSRDEIAELSVDLQRYRHDAETATVKVRQLEQTVHPELISLMQSGIESDWLFRTDEFALTGTPAERLEKLAGSIAAMPKIRIHLDGYADARGDADYNQALSAQRVEWIIARLLDAGISPERISAEAHGEVASADGRPDSLALERRVSLTVFIEPAGAVASIME